MTEDRYVTTRATATVALLVMAGLAALTGAADAASRSTAVVRWLRTRQLARFEAERATYSDTGVYESFEERLLNDEIPSLPQGAPFLGLLGASNVSHSVLGGVLGDDLPPDLAGRLHNVSLGGCSATMIERIVTTLDREKGVLRPGSTFVVGLWWGVLSEGTDAGPQFLRYPAERWGLWSWGTDALEPAGGPLRPLWQELVRVRAFRLALKERLAEPDEPLPPPPGPLPPAEFARRVEPLRKLYRQSRIPGPETEALERILRRILAQGARLAIVEMPAPSWYRSVPEAVAWRAWIASLAERLGVQRLDLEGLLPDEDFYGEYNLHPLRGGRRRLQVRLVQLIRDLEGN